MNKTFLKLLSIFLVGPAILLAQNPDGYYDDAIGLSGDELKSALHNIIDNHQEYSYNNLRDYLLKESDEDPNNSDNVILIHSGISRAKNKFGGNVGDWNREHVWAKSHGDFGTSPPAGTDAHHIRPSDVQVNSSRGNLDFDNGGSPVNNCPGCLKDGDSFETRDGAKGDVARMIFYMAIRYEGGSGEPDLEVVDRVNTYPDPEHGKLSTLMQWHIEDPVDDFEMNRNEIVYSYQQNRNPFIDHPEFVNEIWGDPTNVSTTFEQAISCYPNPVNDQVFIEYSSSSTLHYTLVNMNGSQLKNGLIETGKLAIDMSNAAPGIFVLILIDENGNHIKNYKLLKTSN